MSDETALTTTTHSEQASPAIFDKERANHMYTLAKTFSKSNLVPAHFKGKIDDCFIALEMAQRMNVAPFQVLQNLYVVHGQPGWSAQFLIAMTNQSGTFSTPLMFEEKGEGDKLEVTCYATHAASGERVESTVSMAMAKAEGWAKNVKYKTMPVQMLRYRAATFLVRTYCPEVTMGIRTYEEVKEMDITDQVQSVSPEDRFSTAKHIAEADGIDTTGCVTFADIEERRREHDLIVEAEKPEQDTPEEEEEPKKKRTNAEIAKAAADKVKNEATEDSQPTAEMEIADVVERIEALEQAIVASGPKRRAKAAAGIDDDVYSATEEEARAYLSLLEAEAEKQKLSV